MVGGGRSMVWDLRPPRWELGAQFLLSDGPGCLAMRVGWSLTAYVSLNFLCKVGINLKTNFVGFLGEKMPVITVPGP